MISHLGSLVLISGIALTIAAPFQHHATVEHHKRYEEPEEHRRIHEEHYGKHGEQERKTVFQEPDVRHRIHEEPVEAHPHEEINRHPHAHPHEEGPIVNYGSINNYFEEPQRDVGFDTGYLVEPYGPSYLVPAYPQVYDNLYEYGYYSSYDIVSYDSLLWEGRSYELYDGLFSSGQSSPAVVQSGFFRYLRRNPENFAFDSSDSSSPSSSTGPSSSPERDNPSKVAFPFDDFFKDGDELVGSQPLDSSFEQDFVSPVVDPPPFFTEINSKSESSPSSEQSEPSFSQSDPSDLSSSSTEASESSGSISDSNFSSDSYFDFEDSYFYSTSDFKNPNFSEPGESFGSNSEASEPSGSSFVEPNFEGDSPADDSDNNNDVSQCFDDDSQRPDDSSVGPDYEGGDYEPAGGSNSDSGNNKFRINSDSDDLNSDSRNPGDFDFDY